MQNFKRKITYFYEHHNGNVGSTAGFMKLEIRGDKVKIIINIQEPMGVSYKCADLYLYHEAGDHLSAIKVDSVDSVDGVLTYQNRTDWQNIFRTERDLYTFDGVAVMYHDGHYYIGDFKDKDRSGYELAKKEKKPVIAQMAPVLDDETEDDFDKDAKEGLRVVAGITELSSRVETASMQDLTVDTKKLEKENVSRASNLEKEKLSEGKELDKKNSEDGGTKKSLVRNSSTKEAEEINVEAMPVDHMCENCPYMKKRQEQHREENTLENMLQTYPKLQMYGATELFDCVRIHPRDIGKLDMRNWKLGVNSFLTHNFYTYQYLLLGKMRFEDGRNHYILGVPGVFSNREKYLANMFGFEQFIPVKQTGVKMGQFGYWIVEVMPVV